MPVMARPASPSRVGIAPVIIAAVMIAAVLTVVGAFSVIAASNARDPLRGQAVDDRQRYDDEQLANAASIIAAGHDLGLSVRDQAIGVMTALGESSLRNIDYGDAETSGVTNPDGTPTTSIGLFQQQDGWGTREQRLDPYTSATLFYRAMVERVPDRESLAPTLVAHRTQINRDAEHYARYWPLAVDLVETLSGQASGLAR